MCEYVDRFHAVTALAIHNSDYKLGNAQVPTPHLQFACRKWLGDRWLADLSRMARQATLWAPFAHVKRHECKMHWEQPDRSTNDRPLLIDKLPSPQLHPDFTTNKIMKRLYFWRSTFFYPTSQGYPRYGNVLCMYVWSYDSIQQRGFWMNFGK